MYKLLILVVFLSGCSITPIFDHENQHVWCYDKKRNPIANVTGFKAENIFQMASARYNQELKRREILISSDITDTVTPSALEFIAYHECAHHQLDHIDVSDNPEPRSLWSDRVIQEEREADCFAARNYYLHHGFNKFYEMVHELDDDKFLAINDRRIGRIKQCIIAP